MESFVALFSDEAFMEAMKATTTITLVGKAAIFLFTYIDISNSFLKRMVGFAVGGLLGDVLLHLIPHAIMGQMELNSHVETKSRKHGHGHSHGGHGEVGGLADAFETIGLYVLAGFFLFFIVEKFLRALNMGHSHSHSHEPSKASPPLEQSNSNIFKPGVILNLVGDFTHNFTDGLALAAAFQINSAAGQTMTYAVALHEIPHEFGDFAVLVNQGIPKKTAFLLQFVSETGAYLGCFCGMFFTVQNPNIVLAVAAGAFLYLSTVSLMAELAADESTMVESFVILLFSSFGIYTMFLITEFEESMEHIQ